MKFLGFVFLILFSMLAAVAVGVAPARATVSTTTSSVTALGNGVTTVWAYSFPIVNSAYAVVVITNTNVTPNVTTTLTSTQYTLTGVGTNAGTVIYPLTGSPLAAGYTITISRIVPLVQTTSLCNQGPPFCAVERALDYLTYIAQQLQTQITAIVNGGGSTPTVPTTATPITRVTSGTTTSVVSANVDQIILWASASTANKTTTLYACATAFSGYGVTVSDVQGTASVYPISVTSTGGATVNGATALPISTNRGSLSFICDGGTNWVAQ